MRHLKARFKLSLATGHRKALLDNLLTSLLRYERIQTTLPKAKLVKQNIDKLIVLGKKGDLNSRRLVLKRITCSDVINKLFSKLPERYRERNSGFSRVYKVGPRPGDAAPMAVVELIDCEVKVRPKKEAKAAE